MKSAVLILPTYNEVDNIEPLINKILMEAKNIKGWKIDLLVSDSRSPDGTGNVVKKLAKKNPRIHLLTTERGLGVGLIKGFQFAIYKFKPNAIAQLDSDGQIDISVISEMFRGLDEGYNLIIGSRFIKGGIYEQPFLRKSLSLISTFINRLLIGPINLTEFNASARAFTPELFNQIDLDKIPWKERSYIILPAFVNEAIKAGAKYKQVPIICRARIKDKSKNRIVGYMYDMLAYSFECGLQKLGLKIPLFAWSRKFKP